MIVLQSWATALTEPSLGHFETCDRCPLSQRERVRVRESGSREHLVHSPPFPFILVRPSRTLSRLVQPSRKKICHRLWVPHSNATIALGCKILRFLRCLLFKVPQKKVKIAKRTQFCLGTALGSFVSWLFKNPKNQHLFPASAKPGQGYPRPPKPGQAPSPRPYFFGCPCGWAAHFPF